MILDSIFYLNSEKLLIVEFWFSYQRLSIIIWKFIKIFYSFFHILQPKQHITNWMQKQKQEFIYLPLGKQLKECVKMSNNIIITKISYLFVFGKQKETMGSYVLPTYVQMNRGSYYLENKREIKVRKEAEIRETMRTWRWGVGEGRGREAEGGKRCFDSWWCYSLLRSWGSNARFPCLLT